MTVTLHLLVGPPGSGKTSTLLAHARALVQRDPGGVLSLAPTRRALAGLRLRLVQLGGVCGLRLLTFADLALEVLEDEGPHSQALSPAQQRLLVEEIVADLSAQGELTYFGPVSDTSGFVEGLLGLLNELQRGLIDADGFARAAVSQKDHEYARLFARYQRELERQHRHAPENLEALAAQVLRCRLPPPLDQVSAILVNGFSDFTPPQYAILEALYERGLELWISLPDESGDERAELFHRPRLTRQRLGEFSFVEENPPAHTPASPLPAGLAHLRHQLFRPLRRIELAADPAGLSLIEGPGILGEVRLVARRIKTLLLEGASAGDILVVARDIGPYADRLREVFAEYGVPLELEGRDPLLHQPAVAILLRAMRLPEDGFPFAGVTALLRHTYFRPAWPELGCPEMPQLAEALLRLLGEPRGREAYLAAVERWAEREQPGLEDEAAEESRRKKIHDLAKRCRAFLQRFFRAWDEAPERAPLAKHVDWLHGFTEDLGIVGASADADRQALDEFWREIAAWQTRVGPKSRPLDRKTFTRRLSALASSAGVPRTAVGPGRVRALSASQARHLAGDHLFLLGLGERGFPRLGGEPSLLEEADREAFARTGVVLPASSDLADEMLLFYQVVCAARKQLVLAYPAVDERGQEMLPGSFLLAVRDCFVEGSLPVERRKMLIERFSEDVPLSPAEYRVRVAGAWPAGSRRLDDDLRANLADAAAVERLRFRETEHGPHDGLFRDPLLIEWVGRLFGPQRVFSPTALEDYVACPFRFLLAHVLRLQPLEEPNEEIQVTRRGMAFHRALARLHQRLKKEGVHAPSPAVEADVLREIGAAVDEDVARAPSLASKELWRLEGQRLLRTAGKYTGHWGKFLEPWLKRGVAPRPHFFEIDFGLPAPEGQPVYDPLVIRVGGVEVRISGRIDRVDVADLEEGQGFWIIDYKTGRSSHYTGVDLAQFRRLQLTLYALAVEAVLLNGANARPLGLAYWLVGENGPKVALPGRSTAQWLDEANRWPAIREQLREWVATLVQNIRRGAFPLAPRSEHCTQTCSFGQVCRISQARAVGKRWNLPLPGAEE